MILRFRHRGLRRLYADDDGRGLSAQHLDKIARILAFLNRAARPEDMNLPGSDCIRLGAISRAFGALLFERIGVLFFASRMEM